MTKMPELRFYSYEEIRRIAEEYSQRHGLDKDVPVDVDRLADNILTNPVKTTLDQMHILA